MSSPNMINFVLIIAFVALFYFMLIRPQQKRQKQRNMMLASLKKGDRIVTIGGLHGTIVDLTEDKVTLKVNENSRLVFERNAINVVLNADETTSKSEESKEEKKEKEETVAAAD